MRLFRDRTTSLATLASVLIGVAMFGATVYLSQYFQLARGMSPTKAGLMSVAMVGGLLVSSITSGRLITRTGRWKNFLVGGMVLVIVGPAAALDDRRHDQPLDRGRLHGGARPRPRRDDAEPRAGGAEQHRAGRHGRGQLGRRVLPLDGRLGGRLRARGRARPPGRRRDRPRPGAAGHRGWRRWRRADPRPGHPPGAGARRGRARLRRRDRSHLPGGRTLRRRRRWSPYSSSRRCRCARRWTTTTSVPPVRPRRRRRCWSGERPHPHPARPRAGDGHPDEARTPRAQRARRASSTPRSSPRRTSCSPTSSRPGRGARRTSPTRSTSTRARCRARCSTSSSSAWSSARRTRRTAAPPSSPRPPRPRRGSTRSAGCGSSSSTRGSAEWTEEDLDELVSRFARYNATLDQR